MPRKTDFDLSLAHVGTLNVMAILYNRLMETLDERDYSDLRDSVEMALADGARLHPTLICEISERTGRAVVDRKDNDA